MSFRMPTALLALAAMGVVAVDVVVTAPTAHGDVASSTAPDAIPAEALLTGDVVEESAWGGLDLRVVTAEDGAYLLSIHNPGDAPADLAFEVRTYETAGFAYGRMGPIPRRVHTQDIAGTVPPGDTVGRRLEWKPEPITEEATEEGFFRSVAFAFAAPGASEDEQGEDALVRQVVDLEVMEPEAAGILGLLANGDGGEALEAALADLEIE